MQRAYGRNVFVNAPFDPAYLAVFEAMVFVVSDRGYSVRCALEAQDGSQTRIDKLYQIIKECRFGIHWQKANP